MKIEECSSPLAGLKTFSLSDYYDVLEILGLISYLLGTNSEGEAGDRSHTDPGFVRGGAQGISRFGFYGRRFMYTRRHRIRYLAGSFRKAYPCSTIVSPWMSHKFLDWISIQYILIFRKINSWLNSIRSENHKFDINIKINYEIRTMIDWLIFHNSSVINVFNCFSKTFTKLISFSLFLLFIYLWFCLLYVSLKMKDWLIACNLHSGDAAPLKTIVAEPTQKPIWNATLFFTGVDGESLMERAIEVTLWDYCPDGDNVFLGECTVDVQRALENDRAVW